MGSKVRGLVAVMCAALLVVAAVGCTPQDAPDNSAPAEQQITTDSDSANTAQDGPAQDITEQQGAAGDASAPAPQESSTEGEGQYVEAKQITVRADGAEVTFTLNTSTAASQLYEQLPLDSTVENFSSNEKIFYPPQPLDQSGAPHAQGGAGTLAYYAPWGNVVMFYGDYSPNSGLFELGQAVSGAQNIGNLSGTIHLAAAE